MSLDVLTEDKEKMRSRRITQPRYHHHPLSHPPPEYLKIPQINVLQNDIHTSHKHTPTMRSVSIVRIAYQQHSLQ